jgi:hypothetical protein
MGLSGPYRDFDVLKGKKVYLNLISSKGSRQFETG